MSTIKSSNEHLTFNADGTSKEIRFQANGTQKASISSAGLFTSTTIDATKLTGTIPSFTSTGIDDNADATAITIDSSERVGIGTTSPEFPLEIGITSSTSQQVGFEITQATSGNDGRMRFKNSANSTYCRVGMDSSGTFFVEPFNGSAYVKHFNVKNDGRVGIGTTSPYAAANTHELTIFNSSNAWNQRAGIFLATENQGTYNSEIYYHRGTSSDADRGLKIRVHDTQAMTIDSSGNVGLGAYATNPPSKLYINNKVYPATQANAGQWQHCAIGIPSTTYVGDKCVIGFGGGSTNTATHYAASYIGHENKNNGNQGYGDLIFGTRNNTTPTVQPTERMRITSDGTVRLVAENPAAALSTSNAGWEFIKNGPNPYVHHYTSGTGAASMILFLNDNGQIGRIKTSGSSTLYETSSDYRLKENVDYTWDATTRLKQLKPARFNFIADDTTTVDGFIAHEVQDIVPEAVSGEKDAMTAEVLYAEGDELPEGKKVGDVKTAAAIDPQGIDQSKLVPLLVKTIQELEARITAGGL